jgi:hypothetical protein
MAAIAGITGWTKAQIPAFDQTMKRCLDSRPIAPLELAAAVVVLGTLGGCMQAAEEAASSPGLVEAVQMPASGQAVPGKPVDIYVRIARLAKACWFVPPALLQDGYVFTANVAPEDKGGAASIIIHEKTPDGRRGLQAFEIALAPQGELTGVSAHNSRIPEPFGSQMVSDVGRWAMGDTTCGNPQVWQPQPDVPPALRATGKRTPRQSAAGSATGSN